MSTILQSQQSREINVYSSKEAAHERSSFTRLYVALCVRESVGLSEELKVTLNLGLFSFR